MISLLRQILAHRQEDHMNRLFSYSLHYCNYFILSPFFNDRPFWKKVCFTKMYFFVFSMKNCKFRKINWLYWITIGYKLLKIENIKNNTFIMVIKCVFLICVKILKSLFLWNGEIKLFSWNNKVHILYCTVTPARWLYQESFDPS